MVIKLGASALLLAACANEYHPEYHPQTQYEYSQTISQPITVFNSNNQETPAASSPSAASVNESGGRDPARVLVLQGNHLGRPTQVVGVVDAHEAMGNQEAALWALKKKAAALGADAIVGVEFHHGEGENEPSHLSGLAVRFLQTTPFPVD